MKNTVLEFLLKKKLSFLIINIFAIIVSINTIVILGSNVVNIQGEISYSTLIVMTINALFLLIKTMLNIFSIIVKYKYYTTEEEKISERVKSFKEILDKEDFRL
jgi:uncharacterized membrane protein